MADVPDEDLARIRAFCDERSPAALRDQVQIEATVDGRSVTIEECRAPWDPSLVEWTRTSVAQLRYADRRWTLYCADRNSRWHRYDALEPGPVDDLLHEIADDPTSIFWG